MKNRIKISDFVQLTGSTLKTILYYHKVGLLPEPERSRQADEMTEIVRGNI